MCWNLFRHNKKINDSQDQKICVVTTKEIEKIVHGDGSEDYCLHFITNKCKGTEIISQDTISDPIIFHTIESIQDYAKNVKGPAKIVDKSASFGYNRTNYYDLLVYEVDLIYNNKLDQLNEYQKICCPNIGNYTLYYIKAMDYLENYESYKKCAFPFDQPFFYIMTDYLPAIIRPEDTVDFNICKTKSCVLSHTKICFDQFGDGTKLNQILENEINELKRTYDKKIEETKQKELKESVVKREIIKIDDQNIQSAIESKLIEIEMAPLNEARNELIDKELERVEKYKQMLASLKK